MYQAAATPARNLSQSKASIRIEELVNAITNTDEPAFYITLNKDGYEQATPSSLSERFNDIRQLINLFSDNYTYSEHLQVFRTACQDINLELYPLGPTCLDATGTHYLSFHQSMDTLVKRIRDLADTQDYRRKAVNRRYQAKKNTASLDKYVRAVLNRYSRTVVVRVDLHYLGFLDSLLRIENVYADLTTLIGLRERNPIFKHETGYIWSVEQGADKGFHVHMAFFFNGSHVRSDWNKAKEIGKLWEQITGKRGYYFNCNADKSRYGKSIGVGTVQRADAQACQNVVNAMRYLAKDDQHLRLKPTGARTFGTGQLTS
jgi:hypothetical protein